MGDAMFFDIPVYDVECPCVERVEFEETCRIELQWFKGSTLSALGCSSASDDCFNV